MAFCSWNLILTRSMTVLIWKSFQPLPGVEGGHFWFISRNELIHWLIKKYSADAKMAIEIGCGTGFVLYALRDALPDARISGSELHSRGLVTARDRHKSSVDLIQMGRPVLWPQRCRRSRLRVRCVGTYP